MVSVSPFVSYTTAVCVYHFLQRVVSSINSWLGSWGGLNIWLGQKMVETCLTLPLVHTNDSKPPTPTTWEVSRNVPGCNEELVLTINHFIEAGPICEQNLTSGATGGGGGGFRA